MPTINALKKAPILDQDGAQTTASTHTAVSSAPGIVAASQSFPGNPWYLVGIAEGTADVTVTRLADGQSVTKAVSVVAGVPFDWSLGAESPA